MKQLDIWAFEAGNDKFGHKFLTDKAVEWYYMHTGNDVEVDQVIWVDSETHIDLMMAAQLDTDMEIIIDVTEFGKESVSQ
jgi:hypothetical protein